MRAIIQTGQSEADTLHLLPPSIVLGKNTYSDRFFIRHCNLCFRNKQKYATKMNFEAMDQLC